MNQRTRWVLTMYVMIHRYGSAGRWYMKRKEGGRGSISVEDYVRLEEKGEWKMSDECMLKEVVVIYAICHGWRV